MNLIPHFFAIFGQPKNMLLMILFGYLFGNRRVWGLGLLLVFFSQCLNPMLKFYFEVPLKAHLGEGFSFPSGHMQAAACVYGWLITQTRHRWYQLALLVILIGIAHAILYFNYHDLTEVVAGTVTAGIMIGFYYWYNQEPIFIKTPYKISYLLMPLILICFALILFWGHSIPEHSWRAIYSLIGFSLGWTFVKPHFEKNNMQRLILMPCLFLLLAAGHFLAQTLSKTMSPILAQSVWAITTAIIGYSPNFHFLKLMNANKMNRFIDKNLST